MSTDYLIIFFTLVFSAFFSGMEIAFISANKLTIALDKKKGLRSAKILSSFMNKPSEFIVTMLVGNNVTLVIFGIMMAKILEPQILLFTNNELLLLATQTVLSAILILVAAEFLPKALFRIDPNRILYLFSAPLLVVYKILWLPSFLLTLFSEFILKKIFNLNFSEKKTVFGRIDLDNYVKEMTQTHEQQDEIDYEVQIFKNALDFSAVKVRECMIPRTEITAIDLADSVEILRQKFIETRLTKIVIYRESIDNIIGYAHAHEMFKKPETISEILLPVSVMPESMAASDALKIFIKEKKSIAIVVDEFGGTSGLLTVEDVVEEIFGEIEDEHDTEQQTEKKLSETEYEFSARLEIDYLNDKYVLGLPKSEEYETLAGFLLFLSEGIPRENEKIEYSSPNGKHWIFNIKKVTARRIEIVQMKLIETIN